MDVQGVIEPDFDADVAIGTGVDTEKERNWSYSLTGNDGLRWFLDFKRKVFFIQYLGYENLLWLKLLK